MKNRVLRACAALPLALLLAAALVWTALAQTYRLTVESGDGGGKFDAGTAVSVTAQEAPEGKVFYRWVASAGELLDAYSASTTFTMPAEDATLSASYTDKTRVTLTGVSVPDKTYDGAPAAVEGAPETDAETELPAADYRYAFLSTDGGGYASADPPKDAGAYRLIVTVADTNEAYFGTSGSIPFTIAPAALTVTPDAGQTRYIGCGNPAFAYTFSGAAAGEAPAFSGALSGAADASAAAGVYAVEAGTLLPADSGAFLAKNYTLSVTAGVQYAVVPYETAAVASAADTNLAQNGCYTGDITLLAPEGFTIALSQTDAHFAGSVTLPAPAGESMQHYYLKVASGADQDAVTGTKYILLKGDAAVPAVSLYSPSTDAAVSGGQKIIFASTEPVTGVAGRKITIEAGGTAYEADAGAGVSFGDPVRGPWYVRYDLSHFTSLSLAAGTSYTVSAEAGAFMDAAGNVSAAYTDGAFETAVSAGGKLVVYTLDGTASATCGEGAAAYPLLSGQAAPAGTILHIPGTFAEGTEVTWTVYEDGQAARGVDLSAYRLEAELEIYAAIANASLPETLALTGEARYGETLQAALSDADALTLSYAWYSGDEAVQVGADASYTIRSVDIGKIVSVRVTAAGCSGERTASTQTVQKALYAGGKPAAPSAASKSATSITLTRAAGMEYRMGGGAWQDSAEFTGLSTGESYSFTCRVKETDVRLASEESEAATVSTYGPLSGKIEISGSLVYGTELTASLSGGNNEGVLSWRWLRGETVVGRSESYTAGTEDIGKTLTVEAVSTAQSGALTQQTGTIAKAPYAGEAIAAPVAAGYTATTVTLVSADGFEYSCGGEKWQTNPLFSDLTPGTAYAFYQRARETDTHLCSAAGPALSVTTIPALTGEVYVSGEARYGKTMTASFEKTNNTGTLTYTWKRGALAVGSGSTYTVQAVDVGNQLSVEVTSSLQYGSVTRIFGTVQKAAYVGMTPDAPTRLSRTSAKITLTPLIGFEYSMDKTNWQDANTFFGLKADTTYRFYQRFKATATMEASPASEAASIKTSASSDSSSGDSGTESGTTDSESVTALYTLTLSGTNTRVSAATLKSLIKGNETRDVTIKLDNVSYTFFKGTMQATAGQLWYDFGTLINGCIHEQAASALAGDAYVATIHYNYDGALPAKANIRLWLGAKNAGKTLYYYRFDPTAATLTYLQTAVADTSGWVTIVQETCSDYVFCDRLLDAALSEPSPTPEITLPTPEPSPEPTAATTDAPAKVTSSGWVLALLLLAALLFIIGAIWLWLRGRNED